MHGQRVLDGVQVLADAILDQGEFQPLVFGDRPVMDHAFEGGKAGQLGGAVAALAYQQDVGVLLGAPADAHGLELSLGFQAVGELLEFLLAEMLARLVRVGQDAVKLDEGRVLARVRPWNWSPVSVGAGVTDKGSSRTPKFSCRVFPRLFWKYSVFPISGRLSA